MEGMPRSLNYELSHDLHFEHFAGNAQKILENGKPHIAEEASTPTISTLDALANSEFLQRIGETIFQSIQYQQQKIQEAAAALNSKNPLNGSTNTTKLDNMEFEFGAHTNHVILDSSSVDQLQQQLEYDKFMNEVWIGIVFTLILISMVFCICSCFLYHQFRTWKRNYHSGSLSNSSSSPCTIVDIEALKLRPDAEDPVPEYTLVSGLPSYEDAMELLHKAPHPSCLIVYPSVFNLFNKHEKANTELKATASEAASLQTTSESATPTAAAAAAAAGNQHPIQSSASSTQLCEATMPLLGGSTTTPTSATATATTTTMMGLGLGLGTTTTTTAITTPTCETIKPNFILPIVPGYVELLSNHSSYKIVDEKAAHTNSTKGSPKSLTHKNQNDKC